VSGNSQDFVGSDIRGKPTNERAVFLHAFLPVARKAKRIGASPILLTIYLWRQSGPVKRWSSPDSAGAIGSLANLL